MQPPLVSVIMPAYNASETIVEAVRSVLGQTLAHIELIVCDDCSKDETLDRLATISDSRLLVIGNEKNLGPGRSRDRCISQASAHWIAFIDSDDAWEPERLQRLLAAAGGDDGVVVFDDLMICHDAQGRMVPWRELHGRCAFASSGVQARDVRVRDYILSPRLLIKPMFPARFAHHAGVAHSDRSFGEDAEYILRLVAAGARLRYLPEPLYRYRVRAGSVTASVGDVSLMRQCIEACASWPGWPADAQQAFARKIASLRSNEVLYEVSALIRGRRFLRALARLLDSPGAMAMLPRRLLGHIQYQLHRVRHRGEGR